MSIFHSFSVISWTWLIKLFRGNWQFHDLDILNVAFDSIFGRCLSFVRQEKLSGIFNRGLFRQINSG